MIEVVLVGVVMLISVLFVLARRARKTLARDYWSGDRGFDTLSWSPLPTGLVDVSIM